MKTKPTYEELEKKLSDLENYINNQSETNITKLKYEEDILRTVANYTNNWEYWIDINKEIIYISPSCKNITGYTAKEFMQNSNLLTDIVHPDDVNIVKNHIHKVLKTGEIELIDFRIITKSKEERWIGHVCQTVYDSNGNNIGQCGSNRDITERKRMEHELQIQNKKYIKLNEELITSEEELRASNEELITSADALKEINNQLIKAKDKAKENEEKFKSLVRNVPGIIYRCKNDKNWTIIYISKEIEKITGFPRTDFLNNKVRSYSSIMYHEDVELIYNIVQKCLDSKQNFEIEYRITDINNNILWVLEKGKGVFNENGELLYLDGAIFNITDRKRIREKLKESEAKLRESNKTKDKFFSIIAHDLKSPLSALMSFSDLLFNKFDKFDLHKQKQFIGSINDSAQRSYKLLENLLLWSRSQRGTIVFNPKKNNLHLLSNETIELLSQSFKNKAITIKNQIHQDIYVKADKNMLLTILRNLISNAVKFTHNDGEIFINQRIITNKRNQEYTEISVKDTGVGISTEMQSKIFQIAESTSTLGTEEEKGTGLGLILCKEFVEKHNGEIWVESKTGKGSEFVFTLPNIILKR